ncbi:hypothetical protein N7535_003931 [Penicillium sp. DV-2018c]|nr:hypothetical protein N7461_000369 [Penicillium sp. DV-2018c]KAJ5577005.1 hypothetical protein N7535_003931 [Penicillium sp. DV-2018c]
MDQCDDELDPFSSASLWRLSKFSIEALQPLESLPWNTALPDDSTSCFRLCQNPTDKLDSPWKLDIFPTSLEQPNSFADSIIDSSIDGQSDTSSDVLRGPPNNEIEENDLWSIDILQEDLGQAIPQRSWERFQHRSFQEPASAYFSEAGAKGFDAALAQQETGRDSPTRIVQSDIFIRSLLRLGLGWSSVFFRYDQRTSQFVRHLKDVRISGISLPALESVVEDVLQCGINMQRMRLFAQHPPTKCKELPALFTLSSTVAVIILILEQQISDHSRQIVSLLQIKALFNRCGDLIGTLAAIVDAAREAVSDALVISIVAQRAVSFSQELPWMESLLHEIIVRVTQPWFKFVETWIGLRSDETALRQSLASGNTFVRLEIDEPGKFKAGPARIDHVYQSDYMPSIIPPDQARSMFESGRSLQLLKESHPHHPIARHDVLSRIRGLRLHCATSWADIERIQTKAQEYESRLRAEIKRYHEGKVDSNDAPPEVVLQSGQTTEPGITSAAFQLFDIDDQKPDSESVVDHKALTRDKLNGLLSQARALDPVCTDEGDYLGPELTSGLHLSLAPILSSQALLINYSCLHLLFKEHNIRHHLNMQWRFQLLGEGSFVARLSDSLFDPEMESGERKAGKVRSGVDTGLRLGSRDTWPPASSELRLVLIGLLGDCYFGSKPEDDDEKSQILKDNELPGGLSFGIRELTSEEVERCRNPNAIEALDFLRLQYTPPRVLESIITPRSLNKYDRLFKHLLRLVRMVSAVKGLVRGSTSRTSLSGDNRNILQQFRVDAQHFVLAVSDYCFHIGIGSIWQRFQDTLDKIEHCVNRGDIDGTIEAAHSVPRLRDYHEDILDQMLFAFFLSKRHAQAAKLLESIFGTILAFGPLSRADSIGMRNESEGAVLHLYRTFRKQTNAFVNYLRGLESGKATSKSMAKSGMFFSSGTDPTSVFEHLRVRLDVKKYY